ncbi:MAG: Transcriptional regulatory protein DegU [Pseudomonadota bacterium]|jgi:two-component system, NarL family, nitrate/nitrite response regulator NarL
MTEKSRLMVVDDHPLFRRGLVSLLSYDQRFHVVCEAGDVSEALRLVRSMSVELVLLDNHLPGVRGVDAIASFKELDPTLKVVMLTVSEDEDDLAKALKSGADGYLLKTADSEQLSETLHRIMEGESVISPQMMNKLVATLRHQGRPSGEQSDRSKTERLSPREHEIVLLIAKGLSNKLIARELDIAETTVKIHVQHVFKKLELSSRVQVALFAASGGLPPAA